ncbi:hypothetical protein BASA50_010243 [Batrachochytrium salamandrivorans]|uniref:VWFD domain-containing protein n=1 Tax=Batrachochytrium salamandrivorans TaxID=1357716 RepID=A0ABQ8EZ55_9FUNG|nr:hypothetical protein BASA50_010243 [Batrachochytrium salamandrivorans]
MLSRLIVTFLCAAAIGSVSGTFLTFDPAEIEFEDIEATISLSVKLNSKPAWEVAVSIEHPFMFMSDCRIIFNTENWDVPQQLTANPAPLYERDIEVQVFMDECKAGFSCIKKVLVRYGYSVMGMDVSGPAKDISEYSVTKVTQNTNGIQYNPGAKAGEHRIDFSYGSELEIIVVNKNGIVSLRVFLTIVAGYPSSRGLCNIPRPYSSDNQLVGSDGTLYKSASSEVDAFVDSWKVKDEDVLTNPGAKTLNLPPRQPGTVCTIPKTHGQILLILLLLLLLILLLLLLLLLTTTTTMDFSTHVLSFTVDLSESTLSPTITYVLSSTTITTSPSTTSLSHIHHPPYRW